MSGRVKLCDWVQEHHRLTSRQKQGLKHGYGQNCDNCQVVNPHHLTVIEGTFKSIYISTGASEGFEQSTYWRGKLLFTNNDLHLQCFVSSEASNALGYRSQYITCAEIVHCQGRGSCSTVRWVHVPSCNSQPRGGAAECSKLIFLNQGPTVRGLQDKCQWPQRKWGMTQTAYWKDKIWVLSKVIFSKKMVKQNKQTSDILTRIG